MELKAALKMKMLKARQFEKLLFPTAWSYLRSEIRTS